VTGKTDILAKIVATKRQEVAEAKRRISMADLLARPEARRQPLSLIAALAAKPFAVIAEMKRSSPSGGQLRPDLSPSALAPAYERHGAASLSVLTDFHYFGGSLEDLRQARAAVRIPVLRKDFIIDEYQLAEARAFGADAVLLIARILDRTQLADLHAAARRLGLECLVEIHEPGEIDKIDFATMRLIGINNRNLDTLVTDVNQTLRICPRIPAGTTIVSESGIRNAGDLRALARHGIRAALIGEHFMKSENPALALRELLDSFAISAEGQPGVL
jgi:indole-3-glycerol phosphate synthase